MGFAEDFGLYTMRKNVWIFNLLNQFSFQCALTNATLVGAHQAKDPNQNKLNKCSLHYF